MHASQRTQPTWLSACHAFVDSVLCNAGPQARRSAEQQWGSAADRFGEIDIITGRRVRDLKLDPVLQLAEWQRSLFGSREGSVSESADEDSRS
jgi:hypothetical protein